MASHTDLIATVSKERCRAGFASSHAERRRAWLALALRGPPDDGAPATITVTASSLDHGRAVYEASLQSVFGSLVPAPRRLFSVPFLGVEPHVIPAGAAALLSQPTEAASGAHDRLVCVCTQLRGLQFAPQVPALALLLLTELTEWETAAALEALLGGRGSAHGAMLMQSRRHEAAFVRMFRTLVKSYFPQLSAHVERLGAPVRAIFASWFRYAVVNNIIIYTISVERRGWKVSAWHRPNLLLLMVAIDSLLSYGGRGQRNADTHVC